MTSQEHGAATILDVARLAGVSRTTVSRVLNEPDKVPNGTLLRVREAAEQLRYVPSAAARSLRNGRTGTVALLVGDVSQPFHGGLAQTIAREAHDRAMSVMLYDLGHSEIRLRRVLEKLPKQGVDAVILATADALIEPESMHALDALHDQGILVISAVDRPQPPYALSLGFNHGHSARQATAELQAAGATSIALLVGSLHGTLGSKLAEGYRAALADSAGGRELIVEGEFDFTTARTAFGELLDREPAIDGLVAATIPMALGAIRAAEDHGKRVPGELSIISCEEVPLAAQVRPSISSISIDAETHGRAIMSLTVAALAKSDVTAPRVDPVAVYRETFPAPTNPVQSVGQG